MTDPQPEWVIEPRQSAIHRVCGAMETSSPSSDPRTLSIVDAISAIVGIIVGSGIFFAPAAIAAITANPFHGALLWLAGGVVVIFGALTYAECAARIPRNGGFILYYEQIFGRPFAFIAGWLAVLLTYPASLAGMAMIGAHYAASMVPEYAWQPTSCALCMLALCSVVHLGGIRLSKRIQQAFTLAKVGALLMLAIGALIHLGGPASGSLPPLEQPLDYPKMTYSLEHLLTAFAVLLWTYDGWTDITMIAGEMRSAKTMMAPAAMLGLACVAVIYGLIQIAVQMLLPAHQAAASTSVVSDAIAQIFGPTSAAPIAGMIAFSVLGAVLTTMLILPRLIQAMVEQGALPKWLGQTSPNEQPWRGLCMMFVLASLYVVAKPLQGIVTLFSFSVWLYYGLTAVACLALRRRQVGEPLPWQLPFAKPAPYILLLAALGMTSLQIMQHPWAAGLGVTATLLILLICLKYPSSGMMVPQAPLQVPSVPSPLTPPNMISKPHA